MGFVLIDSGGKRVKDTEGKITPYFKYPAQAFEYTKKYFNNSPYVHIHEVRKKCKN